MHRTSGAGNPEAPIKVSVGGIYDFIRTERVKFRLGGLVSRDGRRPIS